MDDLHLIIGKRWSTREVFARKATASNTKNPTVPPIIAPNGTFESPGPEAGTVKTTDGVCTTRVPLGNPFLFKLPLSTLWSFMSVCCPTAIMTDVCTWIEAVRSNRPVMILEDRVETSSMLRILTISLLTPAVWATLEIYRSWFAMK